MGGLSMPVNSNFARTAGGLFLAAVLLALVGCGPRVSYAPVQGKVSLDGKPLAGVKVWFYPLTEGNTDLPFATGTTDSSGVYTLTSNNGRDGAMVGKHRVVLNWPVRERTDDRTRPPPPQGPVIPIPYTQATDTPFIFEVKPGGAQTIDLPMHLQP
jgi:hypothetical protein